MNLHIMWAALSLLVVAPLPQDPSLTGPAICGKPSSHIPDSTSRRDADNIVLLDVAGAVLLWDAEGSAFELTLDGAPVLDLVTGRDERGSPTFAGLWSDGSPTVSGNTDDPSSPVWIVEISRPGHKPARYTVTTAPLQRGDDPPAEPKPRPVIVGVEICDCSDQVGLTCKLRDCKNHWSCSSGFATCRLEK